MACSTMGHEGVQHAARVVLFDCDCADPQRLGTPYCLGHPYCQECTDALLSDDMNRVALRLPDDPTTFCESCGCHDQSEDNDCGGGCQNFQCGCARQPSHHAVRVEAMRAFMSEPSHLGD